MTTKYPAPNPPFIGARYHGGPQTPKAIVIHGTVSSDNKGTARQIAGWWHGPTSPLTSAHYVVDPAETIQCVGDHNIAYHCGYNTGSVSIELCDEEVGPVSRWKDADSVAILKRAAHLTAQLCLAYGIEPVRPTVAELKAKGPHGIYGHNDSRLAFGNTTHSDPKDFDWAAFLKLVRAEIADLKATTSGLKATPVAPRKFVEFSATTFNAGSATVKEIIEIVKTSGAAALQEFSDRGDVVKALLAAGVGVITSDLVGTAATPFAYDKSRLRLVRKVIFKLLDSQRLDPKAAGPSSNKPKYFVGGLFEVIGTGQKVILGSAHDVTSQGLPANRRAALKFTSALNKGLIGRKRPVLVGADWNAEQDGASMQVLHRAGWSFTPPRKTHGNRRIDYWIYKDSSSKPGVIKVVAVEIVDGGHSDHEAYRIKVRVFY